MVQVLSRSAKKDKIIAMAEIRRGRTGRAAKLATLPAGIAGRAVLGVGKRMAGKSKEDVNAELVEKAAVDAKTSKLVMTHEDLPGPGSPGPPGEP